MGAEAGVHSKLAEVWGFAESDRGRFDEEESGVTYNSCCMGLICNCRSPVFLRLHSS